MGRTTAKVEWKGQLQFAGTPTSGHTITIDSDRERNSAPGPMELVLMGLCSCTATDVVNILHKKREPFTRVEVHAEAERSEEVPKVYTSIHLVYMVGGAVSRKAVEDAVRLSRESYCSVSIMLKEVKITSEIRLLDAVAAD